MTSQTKSYPFATRLIEMFGDWLNYRRDLHEIQDMCQSSGGELSRIAHDLGVSAEDLDTFVRQGPHAVDELPKLLKSLGLDEQAIARAQPRILSDMQRVCSSCGSKRRCDREISAGTSAQHYEQYCDNAGTIEALSRPHEKV